MWTIEWFHGYLKARHVYQLRVLTLEVRFSTLALGHGPLCGDMTPKSERLSLKGESAKMAVGVMVLEHSKITSPYRFFASRSWLVPLARVFWQKVL